MTMQWSACEGKVWRGRAYDRSRAPDSGCGDRVNKCSQVPQHARKSSPSEQIAECTAYSARIRRRSQPGVKNAIETVPVLAFNRHSRNAEMRRRISRV